MAAAVAAYAVLILLGAAAYGRAWLRVNDPVAAVLTAMSSLAPPHRDHEGRLRVRPPLVGLLTFRARRGTVALLIVLIGGVGFDGTRHTG